MLLSSALPTKMVQARTPLRDSHSIALRIAAVGHFTCQSNGQWAVLGRTSKEKQDYGFKYSHK